jgi:hypothetical protein
MTELIGLFSTFTCGSAYQGAISFTFNYSRTYVGYTALRPGTERIQHSA